MKNRRPGHRVPVVEGADPYTMLTQAGDYYGPVRGFSKDNPAVFFLLPIARDPGVKGGARALHHVQSPPHIFTENPDGTLTIRESIGAGPTGNYYWHGYLTAGVWEEC